MHFIPETIIRALCWTLLHSLWQGLLFAGVAGVVLVLTRRSPAALRYNLLCGGLMLFLLVSGVTFYRELGPGGAVRMGSGIGGAVKMSGEAVKAAPGTVEA